MKIEDNKRIGVLERICTQTSDCRGEACCSVGLLAIHYSQSAVSDFRARHTALLGGDASTWLAQQLCTVSRGYY